MKVKEILAQLNIKSNRKTRAIVTEYLSKNVTAEEDESKITYAETPSVQNRLSISGFARNSIMTVKKKINPIVNSEPEKSEIVNSTQNVPKESNPKARPSVTLGSWKDEQTVLDILKNEFEKRAEFLSKF